MHGRLTATFFIAAGLVAAALLGSTVWLVNEAGNVNRQVDATQELLTLIGRTRSDFNRMLASHRAALLSPPAADLFNRYIADRDQRRQRLEADLARLLERTSTSAAHQQRLAEAGALLQRLWQLLLQQQRSLAEGHAAELALQITAGEQWYQLFDELQAAESQQLILQRGAEEVRGRQATVLFLTLSALLFGLLLLAWLRQRAELRARQALQHLASEMAQRERSEAQLRTVIEAAPNAILMVDGSGDIILVNAELERLFGYSRAELLGQPVEVLLPERVRGRHVDFRQGFFRQAATRAMGAGRDLYGRRRDGSEVPIEIGLSPLQIGGDAFVLAAVTDISVRKRSEAIVAARAAEEATQRFDGSHAAALALFNTEFHTRRVLEGTLALLAERHPFPAGLYYSYEELGGSLRLTAARAAPPGAEQLVHIGEGLVGAAAAGSQAIYVEMPDAAPPFNLSAGFGELQPAALLYCPVIYRERLLGVLALTASTRVEEAERAFIERLAFQLGAALHNQRQYEDLQQLTEQLRARGEEIQQKNDQLEAANRMKSEFLANMSHELRTPLNAIIGFAEVLGDGLAGPVNTEQAEYLRDIFESGQHLLALINDILDLSKIEAGQMTLELDAVDAGALGSASLAVVREKALAHRISLSQRIEPELGPISLDARKTRQIIYNLLSNAVKFTPEEGSVELTMRRVDRDRLEPGGERQGVRHFPLPPETEAQSFLEIAVSDTGIGIDKADLQRLFEPFTQVDSTLARQHAGTGLGLAMVRRLAEQHGGALRVESSPGRGSRFVVWLPWREALTTPPPALPPPLEDGGRRPRVLVVEDLAEDARLLRLQLEHAGYEVMAAGDAMAALALAREERPDAIVLDVILPGMDGWQMLVQLKEDERLAQIPVVIVSITDSARHGFALGAADVLLKPVTAGRLAAALEAVGLHGECRGGRVLVVDDDPRAVTLLVRLLESAGMTPLPAYGGREGLDLARRAAPDMIVLDLMMPEVTGLDVVAALRAEPATAAIPVVIVTAKQLQADEIEALRGATEAVLAKTEFSGQGFIAEVRRALTHRVPPSGGGAQPASTLDGEP